VNDLPVTILASRSSAGCSEPTRVILSDEPTVWVDVLISEAAVNARASANISILRLIT